MCVSLYPARLSQTRLMGHCTQIQGQTRHVIGYQNTVRNRHSGPNAMVLPVPVAPGAPFGPRNFLDTSRARNILKDMVDATTVRTRGGGSFGGGAKGMMVFDHDIYSVAVGQEVTEAALREALDSVPERRRPDLNWSVLKAYPTDYPAEAGWWLAIFCFDNAEAADADPLLYHYQPANPDELFLPALDAHHGGAPVPGELVDTDHDILVGSDTGVPVHYTDGPNAGLAQYLPQRVRRAPVHDKLPNGDFVVNVHEANSSASPRVLRTNSSRSFLLEHASY